MTSPRNNESDSLVSVHCINPSINAGDYRPDIDGLRALAVVAVVAFHAFPSLVPGGFIGVDIFFVISGYLISKHIFSELDAGRFCARAFYVRRVKRIFPALILVLFACLAIGWVILTPGEYEALGKPIAGSAAFIANFVFWKEAGYFDMAADSKPVLHLWSLGVEEQFYIFWPFILVLLNRRLPRFFGDAIFGIGLVSLAYSLWLVQHDVTGDFYSPLSRLWELSIGACLAYAYLRFNCIRPGGYSDFISWVGMGLILVGIAVISKGDRFPGAWALLPTVGAVCIIYAGQGKSSWFNRTVLASPVLVWLGLISYPLYLWHWPLLSFARIMESETPSWTVRVLLIGSSVFFAWLTYRWIEIPVRTGPANHTRRIVIPLALLMLGMFIAGVVVRKSDGFKFRALSKLNGDVSTLTLGKDRASLTKKCGIAGEKVKELKLNFCLSSGTEPLKMAVLGDSKAEAFYYGLVREAQQGVGSVLIGSVRPPAEQALEGDMGQARNRTAFQSVLNNPSISVVIWVIALRNTVPADEETGFVVGELPKELVGNYSRAIRTLEQAGKKVVLLIDNPTLPDPRSCVSGGMTSVDLLDRVIRRKLNPRCSIRYTDHLAGTAAYLKFAEEIASLNPGVLVYDPTALLCDVARNECSITRDGKFLYSYSDHISDYANSLIARDLLPKLERFISQ